MRILIRYKKKEPLRLRAIRTRQEQELIQKEYNLSLLLACLKYNNKNSQTGTTKTQLHTQTSKHILVPCPAETPCCSYGLLIQLIFLCKTNSFRCPGPLDWFSLTCFVKQQPKSTTQALLRKQLVNCLQLNLIIQSIFCFV